MKHRATFGALSAALLVAACDSAPNTEPAERDLSLAPTDQIVSTFSDRAASEADRIGTLAYESQPAPQQAARAPQPNGPPAPATAQADPEPQPDDSDGAPLMPEPLAEPPAPPSLGEDFVLDLTLADNIEVDAKRIGEPVEATVRSAVFNRDGELVIPAGATFRGNIADVEPSAGEVDLVFNTVEFNGEEREIEEVSATVRAEEDGGEASEGWDGTGGGYGGILDTRGGPGTGIANIPIGTGAGGDGTGVTIIPAGTACEAPAGTGFAPRPRFPVYRGGVFRR